MEFTNACRCCLIRSSAYNLNKPYTVILKTEVYADILKKCFDIQILPDTDNSGICTTCVDRLRDALNFKEQVIRCQKQLLMDCPVTEDHEGENVGNTPSGCDEQSEIEWLEWDVSGDENENSTSLLQHQTTSARSPGVDENYEDDKEKLTETKSLNDEVLSLDEVKAKQMLQRKKNGSNSSLELYKRNGSKSKDPEHLILKTISIVTKVKANIENILRNSNCTPFVNKTIAGIACVFCKKSYKDIKLLRKHIDQKHKRREIKTKVEMSSLSVKVDITDLTCNICNVKLNVIADLKNHLTKEHSIKFYPINDYFLEFKLTDSEMLNCALCHSTFETFKMLLQHMNGHYRNYICDVCDHGFINKNGIKKHRKTHDLGVFKCSLCDKVFNTSVTLKCHERYTHNARPRYITNCSYCNKSFTSYYRRNRHLSTEHNISAATYRCNICDIVFVIKSHLTNHIKKVHLMERNHICVLCGNSFFEKHHLEQHMVKHNGKRVFECTVCLKAYARELTLREHMRIHTNDRRFKCGVCSKAFIQKGSMKHHMLSNHGILWSEFENA